MWWWCSVCLVCVALSLVCDTALISSPKSDTSEEIVSPLRVAQCRAQCLQRFAESRDRTGASCLQGPDCFMCWENCALLQSNFAVWGAMCSEKRICFPGCQQACQFHREPAPQVQSEPVIRTRGEEVLTVTPVQPQGGVARWKPALKQRHVVYVLMARSPGASSWRQISQSVECEVRLEAGSPALSAGTTVRVLVVDPEGLVTIYSPSAAPPTPSSTFPTPLESTKAPASSAAPQTKDEPTEPWHLREVSLLHQRVLVIAEVAWAPRARRGVYLVTWELDGGGLRGNLFTDSTSVTLSLWPDTVYHIQVELVSRGSGYKRPGVDRSDPMVIDTRKAPKVQAAAIESSSPESLQSSASSSQQQRSRELLAGTGAAILVFLIVGAAVAWLCVRRDVTAATCCCSSMHKRRRLLADDSISAVSQPSIVSVLVPPKDCSNLGLSSTSQEAPWPELPARPAMQ